jgi:hypothetical protein
MVLGSVYTNGIDKKRPIGMYVSPKAGGNDFVAVVFVPVSDLKTILETFKGQLGAPKDAGDGVQEVSGGGQPVYIKEKTGWAFVSNAKENLADLPADPAILLGNLPKEYTLAVKVNVSNIPEKLKKMGIDTIKEGFERQLQNNPRGGADAELVEKMQRNQMEALFKAADELDDAVETLAARIARSSPLTVGIGKEAFYAQIELDESGAYELTKTVMSKNSLAADAQEGIGAFLEKREPRWSGS